VDGVPTGDEVGDGDGPGREGSVTSSFRSIQVSGSCVETVGSSNVGIPDPPSNIATVPAGDTKMTLEFSASAVVAVQAPLQK
jgi:hypothetical protein